MRILFLVTSAFVFSSCLKEELPVPKKELGDGNVVVVDIQNDYPVQAFFKLSTGEVVSENIKDEWDIGVENGSNGSHFIINYSKNMFIYPTNEDNLENVLSPVGYNLPTNQRFDSPFGEYDSLAMRDYSDGKVRIVDLGYGADGTHIGWYKIKVLEANQTSYTIEYAPLTSTTSTTTVIDKQNANDYQFTYFNLRSNSVVQIAPKNDEWDLVFTQFTQRLYEPLVMPYLVTGTLLNRVDTKGTRLVNADFNEIDLAFAQSTQLSDTMNVIGYDWKSFDFNDENYTVFDNICYVLQDENGVYYKLKFLDFYSPTGSKGYNKFIYQELN